MGRGRPDRRTRAYTVDTTASVPAYMRRSVLARTLSLPSEDSSGAVVQSLVISGCNLESSGQNASGK